MEACGRFLLLTSYTHVFFRFSEAHDRHANPSCRVLQGQQPHASIIFWVGLPGMSLFHGSSLILRLTDAPSQSLSLSFLTVVL